MGNLRHDTSLDDGEKAENGQDDSSSVGCSPGSFLRLAKAEVRDTDFPSPSQLSVPFAEVKTTDSPPVGGVSPRCREQKTQVYHVYPTLGIPNSCCANVHRLGVYVFVCHRVYISFGVLVFVCHRCCRIAFLGRDVCCSLFCLGAVCFVWFSSWFLCSVLRKCVSSGHVLFCGFVIDVILLFSGMA